MEQDKIFGEVRSLLARREHDPGWGEHLLELMLLAAEQAPALHEEKLLPYLKGQRIDWPTPLTSATLDTITAYREALPLATYSMDLREEALIGDEHPEYLPWSKREPHNLTPGHNLLANVSSLRLDTRLTIGNAFRVLLHDPSASDLRELTIKNHDTHPRSICFFTEQDAEAIATAPGAHKWRKLDIGNSLQHRTFTLMLGELKCEALRELDLSNNFIRETDREPPEWFSRLEKLDLSSCNFRANAVTKLFEKRAFPNLTTFSLSGNELRGRGLQALSGSGRFPRLEGLALRSGQLDPSDISTLTALDMPALRRLAISRNELTPETLRELLTSPFGRALVGFELTRTSDDVQAFAPLLEHPNLDHFEVLTIGLPTRFSLNSPAWGRRAANVPTQKHIEDASLVEEIITSIDPTCMKVLVLSGLTLTPKVAAHVAKMENLEHLNIEATSIDHDALCSLLAGNLRRLRYFNASALGLDDAALSLFLEGPGKKNLTQLDLRRNIVGDDGAKALAYTEKLPKLSTLSLSENQIGDDGCVAFIESTRFHAVNNLDIMNNRFSNHIGRRMEEELGDHMNVLAFMYIG